MTIRELGTKYKIRPNMLYLIIQDLEALGVLQVPRVKRRLVIDSHTQDALENELQRRGYRSRV